MPDLVRIAHALYVCELVDSITPEGQPFPRLFRLFAAYLDHLEKVEATESDRRFFEINQGIFLATGLLWRSAPVARTCMGRTVALLQGWGASL